MQQKIGESTRATVAELKPLTSAAKNVPLGPSVPLSKVFGVTVNERTKSQINKPRPVPALPARRLLCVGVCKGENGAGFVRRLPPAAVPPEDT